MGVIGKAVYIVFRCAEKGLEIFLVHRDDDQMAIPQGYQIENKSTTERELIHLEPVQQEDGESLHAVAFEGEYHDIPSLRSLMIRDVEFVKEKIKELVPDHEKGSFVTIKEAIKKVLPYESKILKELKDILNDRNLVKYI